MLHTQPLTSPSPHLRGPLGPWPAGPRAGTSAYVPPGTSFPTITSGVIPWHFYNEPNGGEAEPPAEPVDLGVVSLPKALAAWKDIGAKIVGGG